MPFLRLLVLAAFAWQFAGLSELAHAGQGHAEAACEASHGAEEQAPDADCHWHCATCSHPGVRLEVVQASLARPTAIPQSTAPVLSVPAPPSASIFHPPA